MRRNQRYHSISTEAKPVHPVGQPISASTNSGFKVRRGSEVSRPAIGVMLSDAMRHISVGRWWLALFPGAMLLAMVLAFEALGGAIRRLTDPREAQC